MKPTMIVLAGPNGAGKSTLYETRIKPRFAGPFINADVIQREELRDTDPEAAYEAARMASQRRAEHLEQGRDFVTETVFSHPSKLDLIAQAKDADFDVIVMHVSIENPDLAVARVEQRVDEGGHTVPDAKIRARYKRGGGLIRQAVLTATHGIVFDNSRLNQPPIRCLAFARGKLTAALPNLPAWVRATYANDLVIRS